MTKADKDLMRLLNKFVQTHCEATGISAQEALALIVQMVIKQTNKKLDKRK